MMRLKKGSIVEVLSREEQFPIGSWRPAEIVSGNGHTYLLKFGGADAEPVLDRIPRKLIRPCPPPVIGEAVDWAPGDLVEVLHNLSWITARVEKPAGPSEFVIRVLGSVEEIRVGRSSIRGRHCWEGDKWVLLHRNRRAVKDSDRYGWSPAEEDSDIQKSVVVPTRTLKRPGGSYDLEEDTLAVRKKRAVESGYGHQQTYSPHPWQDPYKVDAFVFANQNFGKNYSHSSFNNELSSAMNAYEVDDSPMIESSLSSDNYSCASSVGSCSAGGYSAYDLPFRYPTKWYQNREDYCSDAESSSCVPESEKEAHSSSSTEEEEGEEEGIEVNRPELNTYISAIRALYASGPMSWEDEEKLTNLRLALDISTDEHLLVLRNLLPDNSRLYIS